MFQTEDGGIHRNIYQNAVDLGFSFGLRTAQRTFSYHRRQCISVESPPEDPESKLV